MRSQVFFEDVIEGMELPQLIKGPYTVMGLAKFGAMIGDFYPTHYDHKWATECDRVPAVVVYGLLIAVHMSQLLTNWVSPDGMLRKFGNRNLNQLYVGETLVITGKVVRKYEQGGQGLVDCVIKAETTDGKLVSEGYATVELPRRAAGSTFLDRV